MVLPDLEAEKTAIETYLTSINEDFIVDFDLQEINDQNKLYVILQLSDWGVDTADFSGEGLVPRGVLRVSMYGAVNTFRSRTLRSYWEQINDLLKQQNWIIPSANLEEETIGGARIYVLTSSHRKVL